MSATIERTVKVVLISRPAKRGYSRWEYRAVECRKDQSGYLNEKGVIVLYRSADLYRPHAGSYRGGPSKGMAAKARAEQVAQNHLKEVLGI